MRNRNTSSCRIELPVLKDTIIDDDNALAPPHTAASGERLRATYDPWKSRSFPVPVDPGRTSSSGARKVLVQPLDVGEYFKIISVVGK